MVTIRCGKKCSLKVDDASRNGARHLYTCTNEPYILICREKTPIISDGRDFEKRNYYKIYFYGKVF